jgi:hypothetical protein
MCVGHSLTSGAEVACIPTFAKPPFATLQRVIVLPGL